MDKIKIIFENYVDFGGKIIFPAFNHNCLYSLDKKTKHVDFLGSIPCSKMINNRSFFSVAEHEGKIFLIPYNENNIVAYDMRTGDFSSIKLKSTGSFKNAKRTIEDGKFVCCSKYKNKLFLFPHFYPALVILNLETLEIQYNTELVSRIEQDRFNEEPYIVDVDVSGNLVYGSVGCSNSIVIYDMDSGQTTIRNIPYSGEGFNGIKIDDKNLILAPRKQGPIIFFHMEDGSCEEYANYPEGYNYTDVPFQKIFKTDNGYFFVPALANEMIFFDINKNEMFNVLKVSKVLRLNGFDYCILLAHGIEKNFFWFVNSADHMLYEYNFESEKVTVTELKCSECPIEPRQIMAEMCLDESTQFGLNEYIDLLIYEEI